MNQRKHGDRYNDEFKKMLVDLYRSGSSVKELNSEYGVSEVTIYKWIKDFTPVEGVDGKEVTPKEIHAILKKEEVNHVQYLDFNAAKVELFKYIESWYNRKRLHGSIGYLTPQEMEDLTLNQAV